jgi:hypothetical protein
MNTVEKMKSRGLPERDASKGLKTFEALPEKKKALSRLQDDTDKTSGPAALEVRKKIKSEAGSHS